MIEDVIKVLEERQRGVPPSDSMFADYDVGVMVTYLERIRDRMKTTKTEAAAADLFKAEER